MYLISLLLAASAPPAVKPDSVQRRSAQRARPAAKAVRSKRLTELEAVVRALSLSAPAPRQGSGPDGM